MEWVSKSASWFWNGLGNLVLIGGWIGGSALFAWAFKATSIMGEYAPFSYVAAGLAALVIIALSFSVVASAKERLLVVSAKRTQLRLADTIDPMENIFQNKRIRIADLVNPYDQIIIGRKFIKCELLGPANAIPLLGSGNFRGNRFEQCDSVEISHDVAPFTGIGFLDCDFEDCRFFKVTLLFQSKAMADANKLISNMHWITPMAGAVVVSPDPQPNLDKKLDGSSD